MVAVDGGDTKEKINEFVQQNKITFQVVMDAAQGATGAQYGVMAIPTNYVIDANGKVAFRCVGYDEAGIKAALAKLGVK